MGKYCEGWCVAVVTLWTMKIWWKKSSLLPLMMVVDANRLAFPSLSHCWKDDLKINGVDHKTVDVDVGAGVEVGVDAGVVVDDVCVAAAVAVVVDVWRVVAADVTVEADAVVVDLEVC